MQGLIAALLVLAVVQDAPRAPLPLERSAPRRLIVTYSDGRTNSHLLKPRGGFWTAKFPRQANPPPHDGLPLAVLQVDFETSRDVVITVSLKYGNPHQKTVPVATVRLGTEPVSVNDLERYGSIRSCCRWRTFRRYRSCSRPSPRRRRCSMSASI